MIIFAALAAVSLTGRLKVRFGFLAQRTVEQR